MPHNSALLISSFLALFTLINSQEIVSSFNWINFTFERTEDYKNYIDDHSYSSCLPAGIKLNSTGSIFISVPRLVPGVPATFNLFLGVTEKVALFSPFPSFSANSPDSPESLISVRGFEIDLEDNIWVLDQGRINNILIPGSPKLNKYSPEGVLLDNYNLTSATLQENSFLSDLVLDISGGFAYISDSGIPITPEGTARPAIIVVDLKTKAVTRVLEGNESLMPDLSLWITINGTHVLENSPLESGIDGIALSCDKGTLFYSPLTSRTLYAISTKALKENSANISAEIIKLGYKYTASDGLMCSQNGHLYITAIEQNSVLLQADTTPNAENFQFNIFASIINDSRLVWPDTLGFYNEEKTLYAMANQYQNFMDGNLDFDSPKNGDANFYIWSIHVDDRSYLEKCTNSSTSGDENGFPLWAIILVVIVVLVVIVILICAIRNYLLTRKKRKNFL